MTRTLSLALAVLALTGPPNFGRAADDPPARTSDPWVASFDVSLADRALTRAEAELLANYVHVAILESPIVANDVENVELAGLQRGGPQ